MNHLETKSNAKTNKTISKLLEFNSYNTTPKKKKGGGVSGHFGSPKTS